jgi:hypothetical protein
MEQEWLQQYDTMLKAIEKCQDQPVDLKRKIEASFSIAQQTWAQIQQQAEEYSFSSKTEEIKFYKEIKPLFKSQINYYNLVYHAELFKPLTKPGEVKEFWIKEQQKLDRFILDNQEFYVYYKSGATNRDEKYFLSPDQKVYFDDLIAMLQALERFHAYISKELTKLA